MEHPGVIFCLCYVLITIQQILSFSIVDSEDIINEAQLSTVETIRKYGYKIETHTVFTEDGYILKLYHIPSGKNGKNNVGSKCTVVLCESLTTTARVYFVNQNSSLGFNIADAGCDLWAGEMRGTPNSRHIKYKQSGLFFNKFWDFSIDEMASIDAVAHIDYVRNFTRVDKVFYIGYSRGTAVGLAMLASSPEINQKVAGFVGLAPACTSGFYCTSPLCPLGIVLRDLGLINLIPKIGLWKLPSLKFLVSLSKYFPLSVLRSFGLDYVFGYDPYLRNRTRDYIFASQALYATSTRTVIQLSQNPNGDGHFSKYDFGKLGNLIRYKSPRAPIYNLSLITAPVLLLSGPNDVFVSPLAAQLIFNQLQHKTGQSELHFVNNPMFEHSDFYMAKDNNILVSELIIKFFRKHS